MPHPNQNIYRAIITSPIARIIIGIVMVAGTVALVEFGGRALLDLVNIWDVWQNVIIAIVEISFALLSYLVFVRYVEKRSPHELNPKDLWKYGAMGFIIGLMLQSSFIAIIYLAGSYSVLSVNPVSLAIPPLITATVAGFVTEFILRGIIFRISEERVGTAWALVVMAMFFALAHAFSKEVTILSILCVAVQAGILFSSVYIFSRSLWAPIFLHFAWDFAEPGIFGAINPGNTVDGSLLTSKITGTPLITGGQPGPQNSLPALLLSLTVALLFLWMAKRRKKFLPRGKK